jgi:hypothetical protein
MFKRTDYKYPVEAFENDRGDIKNMLTHLDIYVSGSEHFNIRLYDIFD